MQLGDALIRANRHAEAEVVILKALEFVDREVAEKHEEKKNEEEQEKKETTTTSGVHKQETPAMVAAAKRASGAWRVRKAASHLNWRK